MSKPEIEIHYADEWAALYVDGQLVTVGDSYVAEEKAFSILGVKTVQDDAFMCGQAQRDGVAQNLAQVESYRQRRDERKDAAARLRVEAQRLLREAETLESPGESSDATP